MGYLAELEWMRDFDKYNAEEQKVLLALSPDIHKWRSKKKIMKITDFDERQLDSTLAALMKRNLVRASFSKKKNIIFGLRERVG